MRLETSMSPVKLALAVAIVLAFAIHTQGAPALPKQAKNSGTTREFMQAAFDGNLRKMQALLSEGVDVAATDEDGENALVWAAGGGQPQSVNFLLDHGVSAKGENGNKALFAAIEEGQTGIVRVLLRHGANVNARDKARENATPLMIACCYVAGEDGVVQQFPDIVRILLMRRANVSARDNSGKTAFMYLEIKPNAQIRKMLLKAGATK